MKDTILKCDECGHEKIINSGYISYLETKSGIKIESDTDFSDLNLRFCCTKCGSTVVSFCIKDLNNNARESEKVLIKCPYDGMTYEKGKLCPNFVNHNKITSHRKKRKANDMYNIHRGD